MDPFGRLSWFILQSILSYLPDLPTLHRLHDASSVIAAFLHEDCYGAFPKIVEAVISHPIRDYGLHPRTQFLVRTIVLVWWRACSRDAPDNPLPASYHEIISYFPEYGPRNSRLPPGYGDVPLPNSTPAPVLCRLLSFSTRLRQMTHACFHGLVARCMTLRPEHLEDPETWYGSSTKVRPRGRPYTPIDIGPPSWVEEQRLMKALLRVMLFFELRKEVLSHGLLDVENEEVYWLQSNRVEEFWNGLLKHPYERELEKTVITWLYQEVGDADEINSWMNSSSLPLSLIYCCPELTPLTKQQRSMPEHVMMSHAPACRCHAHLRTVYESPIRGVDFAVFRPYGFAVWDKQRMEALGFLPPTKEGNSEPQIGPNVFFVRTSILTEKQ